MDPATTKQAPLTPRALRRRRWRRGALLVALLALPLAELGLRVAWPQPPRGFSAGLFQVAPDGLTTLAPGATGVHYSREFHVEVAADREGYRAHVGVGPDARDGAAWCLGDSFLFGWGVAAPEVATARLTAAGLPCANVGMPGDGLRAHRQRLEALLAGPQRPGALVLVLYDNDLSEFADEAQAAPAGGPGLRGRALSLHTVRLGGRLLDGLGLSSWAANLGGYRAQRLAILRRDLWIHDPARAAELEPALAHLRETLARAPAGVPLHVVRVVPVYAAGGAASAEAQEALGERLELDALGARLGELCAEAGASYRELRPATPAEEAGWYFPYDLHLTPTGQAVLADTLRAALAE